MFYVKEAKFRNHKNPEFPEYWKNPYSKVPYSVHGGGRLARGVQRRRGEERLRAVRRAEYLRGRVQLGTESCSRSRKYLSASLSLYLPPGR